MNEILVIALVQLVIAITVAIPVFIAALQAKWLANSGMKKADDLHAMINERMDKLLASTKEIAHAAGLKEGYAAGFKDGQDSTTTED